MRINTTKMTFSLLSTFFFSFDLTQSQETALSVFPFFVRYFEIKG